MKTYELKIFNNTGKDVVGLDLREILIITPYKIFNEENSEETFYFQRNGDLVQSINGMTTTSQWKILDGGNILHIVNDEQKNGTLL
jgi:ribosomal silencing factor RsfS